jgi:hypothetical protein
VQKDGAIEDSDPATPSLDVPQSVVRNQRQKPGIEENAGLLCRSTAQSSPGMRLIDLFDGPVS